MRYLVALVLLLSSIFFCGKGYAAVSYVNSWNAVQSGGTLAISTSGGALPSISTSSIQEGTYPACVTDETSACTRGNTYASGGGNACLVQSDGTNWRVTGQGCF